MPKSRIDTEKLTRALTSILVDVFKDSIFEAYGAEMTIDQITWCAMDKQDEALELAKTRHTFIVAAIVAGGRNTNRYVITINPTGR